MTLSTRAAEGQSADNPMQLEYQIENPIPARAGRGQVEARIVSINIGNPQMVTISSSLGLHPVNSGALVLSEHSQNRLDEELALAAMSPEDRAKLKPKVATTPTQRTVGQRRIDARSQPSS